MNHSMIIGILLKVAILASCTVPAKAESLKNGRACITGEDVNARWVLEHEHPETLMQGRTVDRADLQKAVNSLDDYQPIDRPVEYVFSKNEGVEIFPHPLNGIKRGGLAWTMVSYPLPQSDSWGFAWVASKFLRKADSVKTEDWSESTGGGFLTEITCGNVKTTRAYT